MELQDLKQGWQNAGTTPKTEADLLGMTKITKLPSLKKIRLKLLAETIFLSVFLIIYYDWFDGDKKPFYSNALLVAGLLLYIANDVVGYISIVRPVNGINLKTSIEKYLSNIRRLSVFSLVFSFLYSVALVIFFSSAIHFTKEKSFVLLGLVVVLFQLIFWSRRTWNTWIKNLQQQVEEFQVTAE